MQRITKISLICITALLYFKFLEIDGCTITHLLQLKKVPDFLSFSMHERLRPIKTHNFLAYRPQPFVPYSRSAMLDAREQCPVHFFDSAKLQNPRFASASMSEITKKAGVADKTICLEDGGSRICENLQQ
ncbi:hypothetical protein CUU63_07665 [Bacillus halotolerans]|uniref:Uncharacterized protein n=1 Tax=Bacillus halotolerans TaxID=260554 RepID=A0A9Q6F2E0_9BACI|nr:hypothetical protein CUU63_07665 [Bacillus halotolerans]